MLQYPVWVNLVFVKNLGHKFGFLFTLQETGMILERFIVFFRFERVSQACICCKMKLCNWGSIDQGFPSRSWCWFSIFFFRTVQKKKTFVELIISNGWEKSAIDALNPTSHLQPNTPPWSQWILLWKQNPESLYITYSKILGSKVFIRLVPVLCFRTMFYPYPKNR